MRVLFFNFLHKLGLKKQVFDELINPKFASLGFVSGQRIILGVLNK